jgi:hypothetical protein
MTWTPTFPGANNNEESQATCPSFDGNKDADKFNSEYKNNIPMKTGRQCVYAHGKQV